MPKEQQTEQEQKLGIRKDPELYAEILGYYKRSEKYLKERGVFEQARKYTKMYEGDLWEAQGLSRAAHLSEVKVSIAFDVIETGLSVVTARTPTPDVEPKFDVDNEEYQQILQVMEQAGIQAEQVEDEEEQQRILEEAEQQAEEMFEQLKKRSSDFAKKLQQELVRVWKETKMQSLSRMGYREKGKVGIFFVKSVYNTETGEIENKLCDVTTIFPSPNTESIEDHRTEPFCYAPVISTGKAKQLYGLDSLDDAALGDMDDLSQYDGTEHGVVARFQKAISSFFEGRGKKKGGYCLPIECYMPADKEMITVEREEVMTDEEGRAIYNENNEVQYQTVEKEVNKFPSGYKRVTIIKGHRDWIIDEADCPYRRPPFFECRNIPQMGDFYGISELKNIEDLIMRLCNSASNINDNLRFTGNPTKVLPRDSQTELAPEDDQDTELETNMIGGTVYTSNTQGARWMEPPRLGFDVKWWMEWLKGWIDRITHMTDALRGFSPHANDSGKKVQELRQAAMGTFQIKVDEQVDFVKDLYAHWAWIYQNMHQGQIIQKTDDDFGDANFEVFNPADGKDLQLSIDVSARSIMPDDPWGAFEEAKELYSMGDQRTGVSLISGEHLIDLAPSLEDKARAKKWLAEQQERMDEEKQREMALEQFTDLAGELEGADTPQQEEQLFAELAEITQQVPQVIVTKEFKALEPRFKKALLQSLIGGKVA